MADISVQRGVATAANTGGTTSPGINFGSLGSTIVFNSNNRKMHAGRDDQDVNNLEVDDMSGGVHLASVSSIELDRESGSIANVMRFAWESWEYTGAASGPHEFIVRSRVKLNLTGETTTTTVSGISNIDNCIPFITGVFCDATSDTSSHATAIAWMSGSDTLNVKRGGGSNNTVIVYVTVVEFTGSAWTVAHGRLEGLGADSGSIPLVDSSDGTTVGGGDISDWNTAISFYQYVGNNLNAVDDAIADNSPIVAPGNSPSLVDWTFHADHVDSATAGNREEFFAHVLQNSFMKVSRFLDTQTVTGAINIDITKAGLTDLTASSVDGTRYTSGVGTAYGRGWVNTRLTTLINARSEERRVGKECRSRWSPYH